MSNLAERRLLASDCETVKSQYGLLQSVPCQKWSERLRSVFHRFGVGRLFKWVGARHQMEKKLWKLGRRKVMEAFTMGIWGVRNENRV